MEERCLCMLLYAPGHTKKHGEPIVGDTRLQKMMYMLAKRIPGLELEFSAHKFGAYSRALKAIQERYLASGIASQGKQDGRISLTPKGLPIARAIWDEADPKEAEIVSELKDLFNGMTLDEIIAFTYATYPETASKSEIMEKFERIRLESAISLVKKGKISVSKGALIAGTDFVSFENELFARGIRPYKTDLEKYQRTLKAIEGVT